MLDDLTLIWDYEYTHEKWVSIAILEYFGRWSWTGLKEKIGCGSAYCWRNLHHTGPHIRLNWRTKLRPDGSAIISIEEYKHEDSPDTIHVQIPLYVHL